MIRDYNIEWLEKRVWIPIAGVGISETVTPTVFRSWNAASSLTAQVAASFVTKLVATATNDGVGFGWMAPYDLDIRKQVRFRVHYTQTATSGTVTWLVKYLPIVAAAAGTAGATVIAAPATALDTVVPAASGTVVASDWRITGFGIINRDTLPKTTYALAISVTCTDGSPVAGLGLLGLEIRYSSRRMAGPRRNLLGGVRLTDASPLGVTPGDKNVTADGSGHAQEGL